MAAHAVNRVMTYRQTVPRSVLDDLMAASTRLRSGARETKRLAPRKALSSLPYDHEF